MLCVAQRRPLRLKLSPFTRINNSSLTSQVLFLKLADPYDCAAVYIVNNVVYKCLHYAVVNIISNVIGRDVAVSSVRCLHAEP